MTEHTPWTGNLSVDLRKGALSVSADGLTVIDEKGVCWGIVFPDKRGHYDHAAVFTKAVNNHDRLIQALQFVVDGYDNQDVNHVDFRVRVYEVALDALASVAARPFYGAECPSYPNCAGGCGCGCTKEVERAKAHKATEQPHD